MAEKEITPEDKIMPDDRIDALQDHFLHVLRIIYNKGEHSSEQFPHVQKKIGEYLSEDLLEPLEHTGGRRKRKHRKKTKKRRHKRRKKTKRRKR